MAEKLFVAPSPHVHGTESTRRIMLDVIIALLPALAVSTWVFGWGVLLITALSIVSCLALEVLIQKFMLKTEPEWDLSAIVTGLLLALNLPPTIPLWIVVIGAVVAIGVGKMTYGGLGKNPFNPALVGRVFLLIAYPAQMTTFAMPANGRFVDAFSGQTALSALNESGMDFGAVDHLTMLLGNMGGSFGEVSALALLAGGVYLLYRRVITWHIPVAVFVTMALFAFVYAAATGMTAAALWQYPLFHLLAGGAMLGAIYMATDYSTSPMTHRGMLIYGAGIGVITMAIRLWGPYPEGMSFAILLMNAVTPLINKYVKPKRFGLKK